MSSLVQELQRDAMGSSISTSDLLKKALVVARKLKLKEFEDWITLELKGYPEDADAPNYRLLNGQIKVFNPYRGWQPVIISNDDIAKSISRGAVGSSVSALEKLLSDKHGSLSLPLSKQLETDLMNNMSTSNGRNMKLQPALHIEASQIHGILETVKSIVLEWSLKLEEDGILGEGMTFSKEEKQTASETTYHIKTYINQMYHSQLQQDTQNSIQTMNTNQPNLDEVNDILKNLKAILAELSIDRNRRLELEAEVVTVEAQLQSPKPKTTIIRESLHTIRNVLEETTGNVLASGIVYQIAQILSKW